MVLIYSKFEHSKEILKQDKKMWRKSWKEIFNIRKKIDVKKNTLQKCEKVWKSKSEVLSNNYLGDLYKKLCLKSVK